MTSVPFDLFLRVLSGGSGDVDVWIAEWKDRVKEKDKAKEREREHKLRQKGVVPSRAGRKFFACFQPGTLAVLSLVNKSLRQIVCHDVIWRPLCIVKWTELELATRVEDDPFPAWKQCYTRKIATKQTELKDIMEDRELGRCDWYTCSNGHLYTIGECRMPMLMAKCPTCGERVGGRNHTMLDGNKRIGAVYREGLINKKISVDDIQSVIAGTPAESRKVWRGDSEKIGGEKEVKEEKRKDAYNKRQEAASSAFKTWLRGKHTNEEIISYASKQEDLDSLAIFRIFFGFIDSACGLRSKEKWIVFLKQYMNVFNAFAKDQGTRSVLIGATEEYCAGIVPPHEVFCSTIQTFYEAKVLDLPLLQAWITSSLDSSWLISSHVAKTLREKMAPKIKEWNGKS